MIIDRMENIMVCAGLGENFKTAADWLRRQSLQDLAPGQIPVDGRNVFGSLADNFLSREEPAYEAHRLYADIQVVIDGKERFYLGTEGKTADVDSGSDLYFCTGCTGIPFTLEKGWFAVFLPGEMHAPGNPAGEPSSCRKLVLKVLCGEQPGSGV